MFMRWLAAMLAWAVLTLVPATARAETGMPIATCIARAVPGQTAAAMFRHPGAFRCGGRQTDYGSGDFWLLSQPLSPMQASVDHVRSASVWQRSVTLHILYADGAIRRTGFTSRTAHRHLKLGAIFDLAIPPRAAPPVRLLWHIRGSLNLRGILIAPALASARESGRAEVEMAAIYAAFAGMCCALLIYNLALWGALRQSFQPFYCLMVVCLLGYALSSSGALGQWTGIDNNDRQRINYLLLAMSTAAALAFARAFFEPRVFAGWLGRASRVAMVALLASAGAYAVFAPRHAAIIDPVTTAAYAIAVGLVVPVLWRAWRRRSNYLWMFAIAWGAPVILAGVRIVAAMNLVPWNFWIDNSTVLSMALEASLSSLAIAYRIRLLSRERDEAREQEIAARLLADTDPLTGLFNRRAFLRQAIGRTGDQTLVLIDIDHFKTVNDTIGHDGGDEVLRVFARTLRFGVPDGALTARLGGEEFAVVLPAAIGLDPGDILDQLRAARMPFDLAVTASIGTCTGPLARETDWKRLYRHADRALFEAKAAGRDRIRRAQPLHAAA